MNTRERVHISHGRKEERRKEFDVVGFKIAVLKMEIYLKHAADKRQKKCHNIPHSFIIILHISKKNKKIKIKQLFQITAYSPKRHIFAVSCRPHHYETSAFTAKC